ncbi:MAG: hypothetical protein CVU71_03655 [Deltaproteobacteria bacterium HGW-Deltaproteobacteria-6]|jgi:hypothetical protein|nr:MAG: hypothetical protein CVU71_03655 [Deltaproteobacteria bacterium HGW-Deltaproteobacteria-6]
MQKKLSEITRAEWVAIIWLECGEEDGERLFMANGRRTPDEAMNAAEEWEVFQQANDEVNSVVIAEKG